METIRELSEIREQGFVAFLPMSYGDAIAYPVPDSRKAYIWYGGGGALVILADHNEIIIRE